MMRIKYWLLLASVMTGSTYTGICQELIESSPLPEVKAIYSALSGSAVAKDGFVRRDNSDIIKVADTYYVWYSKMAPGKKRTYKSSSIWYSTSPDGKEWTEQTECIPTGAAGQWDDRVTYTPGILYAKGKYYLFYTADSHSDLAGKNHTYIGVSTSDSPDGPWEKSPVPVLSPSLDLDKFDSHRVDDSCLITRDGKYWLYYKGRQMGKSPLLTKMGLAIAENPEGPYIKWGGSPVIQGNHEVLVWPQGTGVAAMIGPVGGKDIIRSIMYSADGKSFKKTHQFSHLDVPFAPGAYRQEAFTDSNQGQVIQWGIHIGGKRPNLFMERFDLQFPSAE